MRHGQSRQFCGHLSWRGKERKSQLALKPMLSAVEAIEAEELLKWQREQEDSLEGKNLDKLTQLSHISLNTAQILDAVCQHQHHHSYWSSSFLLSNFTVWWLITAALH